MRLKCFQLWKKPDVSEFFKDDLDDDERGEEIDEDDEDDDRY